MRNKVYNLGKVARPQRFFSQVLHVSMQQMGRLELHVESLMITGGSLHDLTFYVKNRQNVGEMWLFDDRIHPYGANGARFSSVNSAKCSDSAHGFTYRDEIKRRAQPEDGPAQAQWVVYGGQDGEAAALWAPVWVAGRNKGPGRARMGLSWAWSLGWS